MFRTAALRTSAAAARRVAPSAARNFGSIVSRPALRQSMVVKKVVASPAAWKLGAVRTYSAGGSLSKEDVEGRIMSLLAGFDKVNDPSNIKPTAHFMNDLGLDSLDTVEVVMAIEEEFSIEIPDKDADGIHSVDTAVSYIVAQPDAH
ncbi:ACP-like protein [Cryphonectria parasitica EP155]|uniref:Acyl carrier protein n=1 Tax=Cryphonectria parasitica (strain ATCC 38755 / EP155) TaxID=660469 RepID=A0A9P5CNI5_CRYP1|nr:ACP-like protein [Cryphonectria parasitica EP155]KAF3763955.1 ACP-like protein [Cryphonectria parasitica EP155]